MFNAMQAFSVLTHHRFQRISPPPSLPNPSSLLELIHPPLALPILPRLLCLPSQPSQGPEFVAKVKKEALQRGVTFVGPDVATEVGNGNMTTFTQLVKDTREAIEPS